MILTMLAFTSMTAFAQFGAPRQNPIVPSVQAEVEDFKPAASNQDNKQFPAVNSKRQVRAQISAPQAKFVGLDIAGKIYEMTKDVACITMVPAVGAVVSRCLLPTRISGR